MKLERFDTLLRSPHLADLIDGPGYGGAPCGEIIAAWMRHWHLHRPSAESRTWCLFCKAEHDAPRRETIHDAIMSLMDILVPDNVYEPCDETCSDCQDATYVDW